MNYKFFMFSLIYLNSYASQDMTVFIDKWLDTTNVQRKNFLLSYGELPDIALPKDVEYLITQHVLDEILIPFTFEEPYLSYDIEVPESSNPRLVFSEDDSKIAFVALSRREPICALISIELKSEPKIIKLNSEESWDGCCSFNSDGTKLYVSQDYLIGSKLYEIDLVTGIPEEIFGFQNLLDEAPKASEEEIASCDTLRSVPLSNVIAGISRSSKGNIVFSSISKEVFILDEHNMVCKRVADKVNPFILNTPAANSIGEMEYSSVQLTEINPTSSHVAFLVNNERIEVCDYETGEYTSVATITGPTSYYKFFSFSADGRYLAWTTDQTSSEYNSTLCIYDIVNKEHARIIKLPCLAVNAVFLFNDKYFVVTMNRNELLIYHTSGRLVAVDKMGERKQKLMTQSFSIGSHSGEFITTVTNGSKNRPASLFIWKFHPMWKIHDRSFTLKQALLISFIINLKSKGLSVKDALPSLVEQYEMTSSEILDDLNSVYNSSDEYIKAYIKRLLYMPRYSSSNSAVSKAPLSQAKSNGVFP